MKKISDTQAMRDLQRKAAEHVKPITRAQERLIEAAVSDDMGEILYQHSARCARRIYRTEIKVTGANGCGRTGDIHLEVTAGNVTDPKTRQRRFIGLPCGPKARLVLMAINQRAIRTQLPVIEAEENVTRFVGRALKLDTGGRTIRSVKDQLSRLAACNMSIIGFTNDRAIEVKAPIIDAFDIWARDDRQRTLWPSIIQLSP